MLVSMVDGENYYVHMSSRRMFFLRNLNNEVVNAVLWDTIDGTPNFTKNILLGTASGRIFETALERQTKAFRFVKRTEVCVEARKGGGRLRLYLRSPLARTRSLTHQLTHPPMCVVVLPLSLIHI